MNPSAPELLAVICFFAALVNALAAGQVAKLSIRFKNRKFILHFLHYLSEIEVIFGVWAIVYVITLLFVLGPKSALSWIGERNFSEALFITSIMIVASTRPILGLARQGINRFAKLLPLHPSLARYFSVLLIGPLFGSLITEPAAMTVCALLLHQEVLPKNTSRKLLYSTLATLFVNVSIGGLLTSFAAPPVLMVAGHWGWDTPFMFETFGWKALLAVLLNAGLALRMNQSELKLTPVHSASGSQRIPIYLYGLNLALLVGTILLAHQPLALFGLMVAGITYLLATRVYNGELKTQGAVMVGFFLAGLVVLTAEQGFWLKPVLTALQDFVLYGSAIALTAVTDNAALTSLAAQVSDLSDAAKYAILAGAVVGGGLTLIANAPNPAGFSILKKRFGGVLDAAELIKWALIPTLIAGGILWIHI